MIINGDSLKELGKLASSSVQSCITSPPYFKLRDYGYPEQIGQENTLSEYISNLTEIFSHVYRILKNDGTLWLNIGDTYSGNSSLRKEGRAGLGEDRVGLTNSRYVSESKILPSKNLLGVPWRLAFALQDNGWILRQDIIWKKPNPMPSPVTDRCTNSHEYLFLLVKSQKYFFNNEAIKEPVSESYLKDKRPRGVLRQRLYENSKYAKEGMYNINFSQINHNDLKSMENGKELKRNKHSVWEISNKPLKDSHFAPMPVELVNLCILAGSKEGDTILDPFFGSGTVGVSAIKNKRKYIGIEFSKEYVQIAERRIKNENPALVTL